jgi:hypothetical protein
MLRILFFFSDNIMADVASKQQKTALFLSAIVTGTRRQTELTKKTDKPDGKPVLCQRTFSSVFRAVFFYTFKLHIRMYGALKDLGCCDAVSESCVQSFLKLYLSMCTAWILTGQRRGRCSHSRSASRLERKGEVSFTPRPLYPRGKRSHLTIGKMTV